MNFNRKDALRSGVDCQGVGSHGELYVKRYHNDTRHMIIYDALYDSQMGEQGRRLRLFLAEEEYTAAREIEQFGNIKIEKHAAIQFRFHHRQPLGYAVTGTKYVRATEDIRMEARWIWTGT